MKLRGSVLRPKKNKHKTIRHFTHAEVAALQMSVTLFIRSLYRCAGEHLANGAGESRVPLTTPSHFPSDRKQGAVFLHKFGFTAGKHKSLLAKVSL